MHFILCCIFRSLILLSCCGRCHRISSNGTPTISSIIETILRSKNYKIFRAEVVWCLKMPSIAYNYRNLLNLDFWFFNLFTGLSWIISYKVREFPIFLNSSSSITVSFQGRLLTLSVLDHVPLCLSCFKRFCKMTRSVLECFPHSWQFCLCKTPLA